MNNVGRQKPKKFSLWPHELEALEALKRQGRVRTQDDLARLAMIALKAMGLAIDPKDDIWELTEFAKVMQ